ncbi:sugar ABC transporter ATP-binding protein [Cohnella ginsengisoli]|uniref:Sugar ABC transporter ATP-binding protein n=1 Tax=Cohnella ginsengisoli TaxID=425004 RepID=A0A9X4KKA0_9BACL|nr:sugar ABC transporter ATP-binding protein [Cohnella ginsengisoli]MDG0791837.1 sugar ABC transporter ATP-binding protein [Cohnella ginsengisoli]
MHLLRATSLRKTYGGITALKDGNLECKRGKVCGLLGANGSGKSTFSKMISGVVTPDDGDIWFDGAHVRISSPQEAKKHGIIMVHQHLSLIPELTCWENMTLGFEPVSGMGFLNNAQSRELARTYLSKFAPGLSVDRKVKDLSLAQKQFVEIAKAVAQKPKLLILDEPTAPLEQSEVEKLFAVIRELKAEGTSVIFISHRLWEIKTICDHVVVFRNGETVGAIDFATEEKDEDAIVSMISGKDLQLVKHKAQTGGAARKERQLEVEALALRQSRTPVRFELGKGEVVGLGGLQGQGQEQLLLALSGLHPSGSARITLGGKRLKLRHPRDAVRAGMVLVPGDRHKEGLFLQHDMLLNLIYPQLAVRKTGFFLSRRRLKAEAEQIIGRLNIVPADTGKVVQFLSGGNQQKVVVGKWLPLAPKVLLLSDPAKGVDVGAKKELYDTVKQLAEQGTSVLLYASDYEELMAICDRVLILFEGQIVDQLMPSDYSEERFVAASLRSETAADRSPIEAWGEAK